MCSKKEIMISKLVAAFIITFSTCAAVPAFASGYGPERDCRSDTGACEWQQAVDNRQPTAGRTDPTEFGGLNQTKTQTGTRVSKPGANDKGQPCVGPASYCNIYFGGS
ncbi:hypothetical protein SAMN05414139_05367 [Burkholderia sp. D7]|jgi:hypothetical protein|nr:hypothetical protein SAMN05414139_05367 [Burkholderia sp. D7]